MSVADSSSPSSLEEATGVAGGSPTPSVGAQRRCRWCASPLQRARQEFCGQRCRQSAFRVRRGRGNPSPVYDGRPHLAPGALFAYADPPYPDLSKKYYGHEDTFAGEVDHPQLIASLEARRLNGELAGYALSTSKAGLRRYLHLFPEEADFAPWVKPNGVRPAAYGVHNKHEYVVFVSGRVLRPAVRDFLIAHAARGGGLLRGTDGATAERPLPGRKPRRFCEWLFDLLGMVPGDRLDDLFPGTGAVGRMWAELSSTAAAGDGMSERRLFSSPKALDDAVAHDVADDEVV